MVVLQFAFSEGLKNPQRPGGSQTRRVIYTGTHDNDTTVGWYAKLDEPARNDVRTYIGSDGSDIAWDLIRVALASVADTAIVPLQDVLSLESEARMNTPGEGMGNWSWRYHPDQLQPRLAEHFKEMVVRYNRTAEPVVPDKLPPNYLPITAR